MAFYQDRNNRNKEQKRRNAQMRGGFEDEGTRYSNAGPSRGGRKADNRFTGNREVEGRSAGSRETQGRFGGGFQGNARRDTRSMGGQPSGYGPQGRSQGPRAQGPKTQGPRVQGPRPQGDDRNSRDFAPRDFSPRGFAPRSQSPRPYESRPQGEPRKFSPRPPQARPFDSHPAHPPRPARPPRPQENYRPVPPAPPAYNAPTNLEAADAVPAENLLSGRNPIREALKSGRDIEKLMVARGELSGSAREIVQMAKERHIPVQQVDRARLDAITTGHQGMLAFASAYQYHTVEDMLALAKEKGQDPFLVLLDGITDPHNLGAIIRTAECAGAHGVIVQERRAVGLTPAAVKASAGAVEYLPVARVTNLTQTIAELKKEKLWIYAAHMEGEDYTQVDYSGPLALVVGGEGEGVSRLVLEACDRRVSLPIRGQLDSLNASVAAGILLYAAMKGR